MRNIDLIELEIFLLEKLSEAETSKESKPYIALLDLISAIKVLNMVIK